MNITLFLSIILLVLLVVFIVAYIRHNTVAIGIGMLSIITLPMFLLFIISFETSVSQNAIVESARTCKLAPLNTAGRLKHIEKRYAVRGGERTGFVYYTDDGIRKYAVVENEYVGFDAMNKEPCVIIEECKITKRTYYCFFIYQESNKQYAIYRLQIPNYAILCVTSDGKYAEAAALE